jgi:hypothetical protein
MIRRYLFPCVLIMAVSYATAGLAYIGAASDEFRTACIFQAFIRVTTQLPVTKDAFELTNRVALKAVQVATFSGKVFEAAAAKEHVSKSTLEGAGSAGPVPSQIATFAVRVSYRDAKRTVSFANTLCDEYVSTLKKNRASEIEADRKEIQGRIDKAEAELKKLQAIPKGKRTSANLASVISQNAVLKANVQQLANLLSLPPDQILVLARSRGAQKVDNRNLTKNVLIALVAGLLACFLLVLIGEVIAENRLRRKTLTPPDDGP